MNPEQLRRLALSRARQIANDVRREATPCSPLHGITPGDVLDYPELCLFLAVTHVARDCLFALGVRQAEPWTALKELRMPADLLLFRLQRRALKPVPQRR